MISISFSFTVDGAAADADAAVFRDPAGGYGVRRLDGGEVVVPAGTPLVRLGIGQYSYALADAAGAEGYEYWVELSYGGTVHRFRRTVAGVAVDAPAGVYAGLADLEARFGRRNIAAWSQLDNDSSEADLGRIAAALGFADGEVDRVMGGGPFAVPLSPVDGVLRVAAAELAGWWLYSSRGGDGAIDAVRESALARLVRLRVCPESAGYVRVPGVSAWPHGGSAWPAIGSGWPPCGSTWRPIAAEGDGGV